MIVKEKERVGFNFKELLKSFVQTKTVNNDEIEKQLEEIRKQEDTKRIDRLTIETEAGRTVEKKKAGKAREKGDFTDKINIQDIRNRENKIMEKEEKEI